MRKYLIPDSNDEIRQHQMREMEILLQHIGNANANAEAAATANGECAASSSPPSAEAAAAAAAAYGHPPHHNRHKAAPPSAMIAMRGLYHPRGSPPNPSSLSPPSMGTHAHRAASNKAKVLSILDKIRKAGPTGMGGGGGSYERNASTSPPSHHHEALAAAAAPFHFLANGQQQALVDAISMAEESG